MVRSSFALSFIRAIILKSGNMTATGHAIIGTVIAAKIGNPALAIPIAVTSHLVADYFPHWDTATNRKTKSKTRFWLDSILDVLIGIAISLLLLKFVFIGTSIRYAFVIIFAASFLDILTAPYLFLDWKFPPFSWSYRFSKLFDSKLDKPWGIIGQAAVLTALIVLAKFL